MLQQVRRIVTTNGADGQSRILSDAATPHMVESAPDRGLIDLWAMAGQPDRQTTDGADRPIVLSPALGGNVFRFFQLPPAATATAGDGAAAFAAMGDPSVHVAGARHPNMHRTQSIDYIVCLQGRVKLILDAEETILGPFDVVIQRETSHAWENIGDETALMLAVLVDTTEGKDA
ncbi:cupin domain-containing protein [Pseudooceanicola aestuarii]|uniref:cupin domain-containing protein n=1 Tax=Pseudooceanicola aestuarii TaxID=2697319 RepID=UPI0013CFB766|nr:cupin domain-containing protein [Pseudooceanicola aestuarii]